MTVRTYLHVLGPQLSPEEILEALGRRFSLTEPDRSRERLTFLDTFDRRLLSQGLTLSARSAGRGVALRLWGRNGEGWEARAPGTPAFAREVPAGPLREALTPAADVRRLLPLARVRWEEELRGILNEDGKTVARLLLREGRASLPDGKEKHTLPPHLHLLPLKGYEADFRDLEAFLLETPGTEASGEGELSLVLNALGLSAAPCTSKLDLELDPAMEAGEAARVIHRRLLETIRANEEGVIRDLDPEFLHDFRVAVRRTRSALTQVKGVFPPATVARFKREFKWLGDRTGPTRDMDVYLLKIPDYRAALPQGVEDQLEPLVLFLEKKKRQAQGGLRRTLGSSRYARLLRDWSAFLDEPPPECPETPNAHRPIGEVASHGIWKAYRRVLKRGKATDRNTSADALHALRIDCKKLRYLLTFFQSLYREEEAAALIKKLKKLQDNLGDFNDLQVQREALEGFAHEMMEAGNASPETLMAMGRLMGRLETEQEAEREAFHHRFRRFSRGKNRKRFNRLFHGPPAVDQEAP